MRSVRTTTLHSKIQFRQFNIFKYEYFAHLVEVIENDAKLSKLLDPSGHVDVAVQIDGQRGLVDDCLHARHPEVVVAVVKPGVDQTFLAEAEDLPTRQGTYAGKSEIEESDYIQDWIRHISVRGLHT